MYYGSARYQARYKDKVRTTVNTIDTTKPWSGCPTNNSNCILRFTTMSKLFTVGTGP